MKDNTVHGLVIQLSTHQNNLWERHKHMAMLSASKLYKNHLVFQSTLLRLLVVSGKVNSKTSHVWCRQRTIHSLCIEIK